jgi:hypothetical protein
MKKIMMVLLLVAALVLSLLAGCGKSDVVTAEKAQEIVVAHAGADGKPVTDVHLHIQENDAGEVCYSVQVTVELKTYTYLVHGVTGEILSITEGKGVRISHYLAAKLAQGAIALALCEGYLYFFHPALSPAASVPTMAFSAHVPSLVILALLAVGILLPCKSKAK